MLAHVKRQREKFIEICQIYGVIMVLMQRLGPAGSGCRSKTSEMLYKKVLVECVNSGGLISNPTLKIPALSLRNNGPL